MESQFFNRKRFAALLHADWAILCTRSLVILTAGYLLLSVILTVSCLKVYSENATLLQTLPTDMLEEKFAHLTDTATNQNAAFVTVTAFFFLFLIFTPWLWNAPIYNKGQHIRYLLLPASTFEKFARWWLYTVPLSILAGVLIILAADITRVIICNMVFPDYSFPYSLLPDFIQPPPALYSGCSSRPAFWAKPFLPGAKQDGHPCAAHSANAQSCCCPSF